MAADILAILLKVNLAASAAIILAFALRKPVRQIFGAQVTYALWLATPLAVAASLLPARTMVASYAPTTERTIESFVASGGLGEPATSAMSVDALLIAAWLAGALLSLAFLALSQARYMKRLGRVKPEGRFLRAAATGAGPAVIGVLNPRIVLPADFETRYDAAEQRLVLAHEAAHLASGDTLVNAVSALARCLLWFNPLIYFADRYVRIDQELACDAAVLTALPGQRRLYGGALLKSQIATASLPLGCSWPAGASARLKERVRMLSSESPSRARRLCGAMGVLAICASAGVGAWAAQPATVAMEPALAPATPAAAPPPGNESLRTGTAAGGLTYHIETYPVQGEPYSLTVTMPDGQVQTLTSPRPISPIIGSEATNAFRKAQLRLSAARREEAARLARGAPPQPLTPELEATFEVLRDFEQTIRARRATQPETRYDTITATYPAGSTPGAAPSRPRRFGVSVPSPFTPEAKARSLASLDREIASALPRRRDELQQLRIVLSQRPTTGAAAPAVNSPAPARMTISLIAPPSPPPPR